MAKQAWVNRIVPPFVGVVVAVCVWYALATRPRAITLAPETSYATTAKPDTIVRTDAVPIANIAPSVSRLDGQVHFNVNPKESQQIQKVEFYVENKFVGTAFARPYSVSVSENDLTAGTHTVTAKIYTTTTQTKTTPMLFTASPTMPPPIDSDEPDIPPPAAASMTAPTQPATPNIASPTGLAITAESDGTTAHLTWDTTPNAVSYQVWRDGTQIGTSANVTYTDGGLNPGQTYDYKLVAVDSSGNQSPASPQVAITMPVPMQPANKPSNSMDSANQNQSATSARLNESQVVSDQ